jgi:hypothetical protein
VVKKAQKKNTYPVDPAILRELFLLADQVMRVAPWEVLADADIFGIQTGPDQPVGWCCVMGNAGQVFAVYFYQGESGLRALNQLYYRSELETDDMNPDTLYAALPYLGVEFVPKSELKSWDKEAFKHAGIAIPAARGVALPRFESKTVDHLPWRLNQGEAEQLIEWLKAALTVFPAQGEDDMELPLPDDESEFPIRRYDPAQKQWTWGTHTLTMPCDMPQLLNSDNTALLRQLPAKGEWSLGCDAGPGMIAEKEERPYVPFVTLLMDEESGLILNMEMGKYSDRFAHAVKILTAAISQTGTRPASLILADEEMVTALYQQIEDNLQIEVYSGKPPNLKQAFLSLQG